MFPTTSKGKEVIFKFRKARTFMSVIFIIIIIIIISIIIIIIIIIIIALFSMHTNTDTAK